MGEVVAAIRLRRPVRPNAPHVGPERLRGFERAERATFGELVSPVGPLELGQYVPRALRVCANVVVVHEPKYTVHQRGVSDAYGRGSANVNVDPTPG